MGSNWNFGANLSENALKSLADLSYKEPLPVQKTVIPLLLEGRKDVAVEAVTGSGKTVAFLIPVLELLLRRQRPWQIHEIGAVIVSPTSELALQLFEVLSKLMGAYKQESDQPLFTSLLSTGGGGSSGLTTRVQDLARFQAFGATILVATPGRLVDMVRQGAQSTSNPIIRGFRSLEILILDEADRLLDMGFETQLNTILSWLPKQRRTGLFSATQTTQVEDLLRAGLRNPVRIVVREQTNTSTHSDICPNMAMSRTPAALHNFYTVIEPEAKMCTLVRFIVAHPKEKLLIFLSTCACVDYFSRMLRHLLPSLKQKKRIHALHGKLRKNRMNIFNSFRNESSAVLLCTDVMARGVDIPQVTWVLQCDPPTSASAFVHRCGRTARCGAEGQALLFLTEKELAYVDFLRINQKVDLCELNPGDLDQLCSSTNYMSLQKSYTPNVINNQMRHVCEQDKFLYEKSIRAFVSYVQFYRKHECHLLMKLKDLNFGCLANGFGLLRLPRMPELQYADTTAFISSNVDVSKLKYREKSIAKQRALLDIARSEQQLDSQNQKNKPWSKAKKSLSKKKAIRKERLRRRQQRTISQPESSFEEHKSEQWNEEELEELNEHYRKFKRRRKGKADIDEQLDSE